MPFADLGSRRLHYFRDGSGAPLLLIQGMGGHHAAWGPSFLAPLERHLDVVAYDHRGIGESTDVSGAFTIVELAADAVALMDAIGWDSAHVMGISMGGMVAQELVLRYPERVRSLVLGCTYAGGAGAALDAPGPLQVLEAMNTGDVEFAMRAMYEANLSVGFRAEESHYEAFKQMGLSVRVPAQLVMRQAQAAFFHDASARLPQLRAPTLVLHGTADRMVRYSNAEHIAGLVPGSRLRAFDDAGHLFWWEQPALSAELVREHCVAAG